MNTYFTSSIVISTSSVAATSSASAQVASAQAAPAPVKTEVKIPKQLTDAEVEQLRSSHQNEKIGWLGNCSDHKFDSDELKAWFEAGNHTCPVCHKDSSWIGKDYGKKFAVMDPRFCKPPFPVPYQHKAHILPFKVYK
jgi:hypothetical protein